MSVLVITGKRHEAQKKEEKIGQEESMALKN